MYKVRLQTGLKIERTFVPRAHPWKRIGIGFVSFSSAKRGEVTETNRFSVDKLYTVRRQRLLRLLHSEGPISK